MALHLLNLNDVHSSCRQRIEACELWLRRIIHDKFQTAFGVNYIEVAEINGQSIFSSKVKNRVQSFLAANPGQYSRPIDTLLFDDLGAILSKDDVYKQYFKLALDNDFPMGAPHVRHVISIIVPIRMRFLTQMLPRFLCMTQSAHCATATISLLQSRNIIRL